MPKVVGTVSGLQDALKQTFKAAYQDINYSINRMQIHLYDLVDDFNPNLSADEKSYRLARLVRKNTHIEHLKNQITKSIQI